MLSNADDFFSRAEGLLTRLEKLLPEQTKPVDWGKAIAFRWRKRNGNGFLQTVSHPHKIYLDDLQAISPQKMAIEQNTLQFVEGYPANNVLLTGARGTGKSSLIKALLNKYAEQGLRLIEVDKSDLVDLPDIVDLIDQRAERFILFCDDLSFETNEPGYKTLKVMLDGSIAAASENVLIYATSNRRHLMPEFMQDNLQTRHIDEEIHPGEAIEEKIALSERFGLWISFYSFTQDEYLQAVRHWLEHFNMGDTDFSAVRHAALQWALARGSRSGRIAWQFARDWAGQHHAMPRQK